MRSIYRFLEKSIHRSLKQFPVVYIAGPRQAGKTTLVKGLFPPIQQVQYITFDDPQLRSVGKKDPVAFLNNLKGPVILDEIQMVPELFKPLKMKVDQQREEKDRGVGRFLLTGSASIMAIPKLAEALVGRMCLHNLWPLSAIEIFDKKSEDFIDRVFNGSWYYHQGVKYPPFEIFKKASYPELLTQSPYEWSGNYLNTILQRDVQAILEIDKIEALPNLLQYLATRNGAVLNEASLSRNLNLNHLTIKKYRTLIENLFLTLSIPAWTTNLGKRLIKSPKVYIGDINLLSYLLAIDLNKDLPPIIKGQVLENFVAVEINKQLSFSSIRAKLYHYRTTLGSEVDFLLQGPEGKVVALEVKSVSKVLSKDFSHIEKLQKDLGEQFHKGFVIYLGEDVLSFGKDLYAIPLNYLWESLS